MSSPQGRKPKPESYAYSWFLPAEGHNGSVIVHQLPPSDLDEGASGENPEVAAMEARTEQWRHSGEKKAQSPQKSHPLGVDSTRIKLVGTVGWSTMAAIGMAVLATRAGSFPSLQVGILGGVWAGVSAAIWFVPWLLSR